MKTKLFILTLAAFSMLLASCNKDEECKVCNQGKPVEVTVQINGTSMSKATGVSADDEVAVKNLQVLAFNAIGELEGYRNADNATSVTIVASSGEKTIWAVVNAPSMEQITSLAAFQEAMSNLTDNALDSFVMSGAYTGDVADGATIAITVKRLVARVSIAKISAKYPDTAAYQGKTLKVKGIYMINVSGSVDYAGTSEPGSWLNKLAHTDAAGDAYLYDELDRTIENNGSYEAEHIFYPYPNSIAGSVKDLAADERGNWSPRRSILCVEVEFGGEVGYYPVEMPVIERNKRYVIDELVLTRRPGSVPYDPIETGDATVSIEVSDWDATIKLGDNGVLTI